MAEAGLSFFGFVGDSSSLATSSGARSKAHCINFPLISLWLLGRAQGEVLKRGAALRGREAGWAARVPACSL